MDVIRLWKRIGETPLQALQRARNDYHIPDWKKSCYTGRLDPLAQGEMTILLGDQIHQSMYYNTANKTYRFQAILGVSTTSYDPLGRITNVRQVTAAQAEHFMEQVIQLSGKTEQQLPPYSAYRYKGQPLWKHAVQGTLPDPLPTKTVQIYRVRALHPHPTQVSLDELRTEILADIQEVQTCSPQGVHDYNAFIGDWQSLQSGQLDHFYRICLEAEVGTGTFVRAIVYDTAQRLGIPAHTFRITRVRCVLPQDTLCIMSSVS